MALPPLLVVLQADIASFQSKMGIVKGEMASVSGVGNTAFSGMAALGKVAFLGLGAAAIGGSALALKMGADFQTSMTQLVTGAGESRANIETVSKGILKLAGDTGTSAAELAKGMYNVESAGFHGAAGLKILTAAAEGAKVGNASMATVANAVTSALNAYHLSGDQATSVTNNLIAAVGQGKMHMEDLAGALGTILPAASTARVSLAQVTGAIATMTMQGTPAADAATYLRQTLLQLENPSAKAKMEMQALGLSSIDVSTHLGERGLTGTLTILTDAIKSKMGPAGTVMLESLQKAAGSTTAFQKVLANLPPTQQTYVAALANMVGGTKSMQAALELTGPNLAVFKDNVAKIEGQVKTGGSAIRGWSEIQKDLNQRISQGVEGTKAWIIQVGTVLIPIAIKAMDTVAAWSGWLGKHQDIVKAVAFAVGTILVIAIGAYTYSVVTAAAATFLLIWPLVAAIAVIAGVAFGLSMAYQHVKWFHDAVNALAGFIGGVVIPILGALVGGYINVMAAGFRGLANEVTIVWSALVGLASFLGNAFKTALSAVTGPIQAVGAALQAINPFAKHSPSLVENVAAGVEAIKGHYMSVSGMRLSAPSIGGMTAGAGGLNGIPAGGAFGGSNAGGVTVHVTVQGNVLNWNDTAQQLAEPIRAALLQKKRSLGTLGLA